MAASEAEGHFLQPGNSVLSFKTAMIEIDTVAVL